MLYDDYIDNDENQEKETSPSSFGFANDMPDFAKGTHAIKHDAHQNGNEIGDKNIANIQGQGIENASNVGGNAGEASSNIAKNTSEAAAKGATGTAAAEGAGAAAAPATAGISLAITVGLGAAKKGIREFQDMTATSNTSSDNNISPLAVVLILVIIFILFFATFALKITPGSNENYKETSYSYKLEEGDVAVIEKTFSEAELEQYNNDTPLKEGAEAYLFGVDENTGFRNAMHDAITEQCHEIVKNLGHRSLRRFIEKYDKNRSLSNFYLNPWPYDLQESEEEVFPRIGDVMGVGYFEGVQYGAYEPQYNDVNYAEVLTILSQNPEYDWRNCKFEKYNEYIRTEDAKKFYYELEVTWIVVYEGEKGTIEGEDGIPIPIIITEEIEYGSEEEACDSPETIMADGVECKRESYYCNIKVKPFGLRALYMMAEAEPEEKHNDFYYHTNIEMLDYGEYLERVFLREAVDLAGPSYKEPRSELSTIYEDLAGWYGEECVTGRSGWYYIEDPYNYSALTGEYETPEYLLNLTPEELALIRKALLDIEGGNKLDMMKIINQWEYKNDKRGESKYTIAKAGCMDTSMYMIYQYYAGKNFTPDEVRSLSKNYVYPDGNFMTNKFMADYGLKSSGNIRGYANFVDGIQKNINAGQPVLLHIRGQWENSKGTGEVYHGTSNGHFLVGVGYDQTGVYVNDPGTSKNNSRVIPWDEWKNAGDLYYREITPA